MANKKTAKTKTAKAPAVKKEAPAKKTPVAAKTVKAAKVVEPELFDAVCPATCACEIKAPKAEMPAKAPKAAAKPAAPKTTRVTFRIREEVGAKVFLAGSFNNWDATAKQLTDKNGTGEFTCCLNLPKGRYEYKFVVNGTWKADGACADWVTNDMGTINSVITVE
ncbi:MAG: glycogen-binding domain-containing protein [Lentisphaeraceae bacterium]|nr:glycogen-binding domain-containing protein [Lentisphaeraceae bacterium]